MNLIQDVCRVAALMYSWVPEVTVHYVSNARRNVVAMLIDYLNNNNFSFNEISLTHTNEDEHNISTQNCLIESVLTDQLTTEAAEKENISYLIVKKIVHKFKEPVFQGLKNIVHS